MAFPDISESEWIVMEALWEDASRTASALAQSLRKNTGWAENTVRTLLTPLVDKGALRTIDAEGARQFEPAVQREHCVRVESESFLQRVFQGAAKPLLVHFASHARLTPQEVKELKRLLDQSIEK